VVYKRYEKPGRCRHPEKGITMSTEKKQSYGMSVILLIMGIVLLIWSDSALRAVAIVIGIGCIAEAAVMIVSGLRSGRSSIAAGGIILIIIGLVFVLHPAFIISILPILIGIGIIINGAGSLYRTVSSRDNVSRTAMHILLAVITILLGLIVLFNPFETMSTVVKIIGIIMIYNSITSFLLGREL
jgi:uncharacterized membrane protein HdeD (DUF308 family)